MNIDFVPSLWEKVKAEMAKVIVGQEEVKEQIWVALLAKGHLLLEGVPGIAKTLMVKTLAKIVDCNFKRIQFTPDLMPSDVVGTNVFNIRDSSFALRRGSIFTDFLLADEVNRTPPKTQSALLEAMEEFQVTIDGENHGLSPMFTVFATQNPIEYEGTYPLPEAQLDRFLFKIQVRYPDLTEEKQILSRFHQGFDPHLLEKAGVAKVADQETIFECRRLVSQVVVDESVINYISNISLSTRNHKDLILGGSPRASIALLQASKALAAIRGREYVIPDDIKTLSFPIFRHRIILKPEAEIEGLSPDEIIDGILKQVEVPR